MRRGIYLHDRQAWCDVCELTNARARHCSHELLIKQPFVKSSILT